MLVLVKYKIAVVGVVCGQDDIVDAVDDKEVVVA